MPESTVLALRIPREAAPDEAMAAQTARARGFNVARTAHDDAAFVFVQHDGEPIGTWPLGDGPVVIVGRADPPVPSPRVLTVGQVRAEDLVDMATLVPEWEAAAKVPAKRALRSGYLSMGEDIGMGKLPFDTEAPRVALFIKDRMAGKVESIAQTALDSLRSIISGVVDEGQTVDELSQRIREHFDTMPSHASMRIARTETTGLYNQAGVWAMADSGVVEMKEWLSSRDAFVRPSHVEADGQRVKVGEDFVLAGGRGPAPGLIDAAEESINCRCGVVGILEGEPESTVSRADRWAKHDARLLAAEAEMARTWMGLFEGMGERVLRRLAEVIR